MRSCPDICDEVVARLKRLGFPIDDSEDHEQIFAALSEVQFALTSETTWLVKITVAQVVPGAELDSDDADMNPAGNYEEVVSACSEIDAIERAKDQLHHRIPIASLDDFVIDYTASARVEGRIAPDSSVRT